MAESISPDIHCEVTGGGEGIPLVLVHGFPLDSRMWLPQKEFLQGRRPVLLPDLPGFGRSPDPARSASIDGYASALKGELDRRDIGNVVLAGFSMGGYTALAFAEHYPERLAALVLANTRAAADSEEGRAARTQAMERVREADPVALAEETPAKLLCKRSLHERPELVRWVDHIVRTQRTSGVVGGLEAMRDRPDRTALLPHIKCPVLVVGGEMDPIVPAEEVREMAAAVPGGRLKFIAGSGHLSNLEQPEAFNSVVEEFLREADL